MAEVANTVKVNVKGTEAYFRVYDTNGMGIVEINSFDGPVATVRELDDKRYLVVGEKYAAELDSRKGSALEYTLSMTVVTDENLARRVLLEGKIPEPKSK